jgi:hypothetical protein
MENHIPVRLMTELPRHVVNAAMLVGPHAMTRILGIWHLAWKLALMSTSGHDGVIFWLHASF